MSTPPAPLRALANDGAELWPVVEAVRKQLLATRTCTREEPIDRKLLWKLIARLDAAKLHPNQPIAAPPGAGGDAGGVAGSGAAVPVFALPNELITHIASFLPKPDYLSLLRTHRALNVVLSPSFYRQAARQKDRAVLLRDAIKHSGQLNTIKSLVAAGVDVHARFVRDGESFFPRKTTALIEAAGYCYEPIVRYLLETRPGTVDVSCGLPACHTKYDAEHELDEVTIAFRAALMSDSQKCLQASGPRIPTLKLLLDHGADAQACARSFDRGTPLHLAARIQGPDAGDTIQLLLQRGACVNARDNRERTPLHAASTAGAVRTLVMHGADIEARNNAGQTPLLAAAGYANLETIRALVENGADINATCTLEEHYRHHSGLTVLMSVLNVVYGNVGPEHTKIAQYLLENGAKITRDCLGCTPLMYLVRPGITSWGVPDKAAIDLLLKYGDNINAVSLEGQTALDVFLARESYSASRDDFIHFLQSRGALRGDQVENERDKRNRRRKLNRCANTFGCEGRV